MMGVAHAASGVLAATATKPIADQIGADPALWYAIWVGGVMLCDLDMHGTHGARVWGPPTRALGWAVGKLSGGHRFETHNWKRAPLVVLALGLACVAALRPACDYLAGVAAGLTEGAPLLDLAPHAWARLVDLTAAEKALTAAAFLPVAAVGLLIGISLRMVGGAVTTGTAGKFTKPLRNPAANLTASIAAVFAAASHGPIWWVPFVAAAAIPIHCACDSITEEGIPRARLRGPMPPGRVGLRLFETDSPMGRACAPIFLLAAALIAWNQAGSPMPNGVTLG